MTTRIPHNHGSILALDLAHNLGWAVLPPSGEPIYGTVSFKPGRFEGGGMVWMRFLGWLDEMLATMGPFECIYFEEVRRHIGTQAAHSYGGFLSQLTSWCELHKIPYQGVPVGTIKKHATGKGNAGKDEVIAAMRALGYSPRDDNDADALALLLCMTTKRDV